MAARVDPSDVLHDAYLEASRQWDAFCAAPPMSLFDWLRFLVRQRLMALHRWHLGTRKRDANREFPSARQTGLPLGSCAALSKHLTSSSQAAIRSETQRRLLQWMQALGEQDQEILVLRHEEELSNRVAAEELDISPAAASKRYIRALERLKSVADRVGGPAER